MLTLGSPGTIDFLDWFIPVVAAWFIRHGAARVWRRDLSMFGHLSESTGVD